jgi:hypothetical protein
MEMHFRSSGSSLLYEHGTKQMSSSRSLRRFACVLMVALAACGIFLRAQQRPAPPPPVHADRETRDSIYGFSADTPFPVAVAAFNARAHQDPIGRSQPPLTTAELAAAIRAIGHDQGSVPSAQLAKLRSIASTQVLPKGSYLRFIPGLIAVDGYDIDCWWIDLQLDLDKYPTDLADQPMHYYRLRTVYVSSRSH